MIDAKELAEQLADLLNSMLDADPTATHALCINRMPCNEAMANHPTVIVDQLGGGSGRFVVGLIGVLNGLLYASPWRIAMIFDDSTAIGARPLLRFQAVPIHDDSTPAGAAKEE